jgi:hypothetical protein
MTGSPLLGVVLAVLIFALALGWVDRATARVREDSFRRDAEQSGLIPAHGEENGQ